MDELLRLAEDPNAWAALATLIAMEVVLGLDNLVFIAILTAGSKNAVAAWRAFSACRWPSYSASRCSLRPHGWCI